MNDDPVLSSVVAEVPLWGDTPAATPDVPDQGVPGIWDRSPIDAPAPSAPPIAAVPDPAPAPIPAAPALESAEARADRLERELAAVRGAPTDWAQVANASAAATARELVGALAQQRDVERAQHWQQQAMRPPAAPDREQLLTDPDVLDGYIQAQRDYTLNAVQTYFQQNVAPQLAQVNLLSQVAAPLIQDSWARAASAAKETAGREFGISGEQFDQLLPQVTGMIQQSGMGVVEKLNARGNPDALVQGVLLASRAAGVPVNAPAPPPRAPASGAGPRTPAAGVIPFEAHLKSVLGVEMGPEERAEYHRRRTAAGRT